MLATDTVNGRALRLVYGAETLPLEADSPGLARSKAVRAWLRGVGAGYTLRTRDGATETWWAADREGVSLAAAIEDWLAHETAQRETVDLVCIGLDEKVYFAELAAGLVTGEQVLIPERAAERLRELVAAERWLYAFGAGRQNSLVAEYVELAPPPFDLTRFRYRRVAGVFTRHQLYHPAQAVAAVAVLAAGLALYQGQAWWRESDAREAAVLTGGLATAMEPGEREVEHNAAVQLAYLAGVLREARALYGDGLSGLAYDAPAGTLVVQGTSPAYPAVAKTYATKTDAAFTLDGSGWQIRLGAGQLSDPRPLGLGDEDALARLYRLNSHPVVRLTPAATREDGEVRYLDADLSVADASPYVLDELAGYLADYPATVRQAGCAFADWRVGDCTVQLSVAMRQ